MLTIPVPDPIDYLVKREFPELVQPLHPMAKAFTNDGIVYEDDETKEWKPPSQKVIEKAEKLRERLAALPKPEVKKLYRDELSKQYDEQDKRRYFNQLDAEADFDYWAKMAHWKLDEAIALSFGKNPEIVYWKRLEKILAYTSPFVQKYSKIRELVIRAKIAGKLSDPILPQQFINWAISNQISFPKNLYEKVRAKWTNFVDWEKMYKDLSEENKRLTDLAESATDALMNKIGKITSDKSYTRSLQTRERQTLHKMIIGMAKDAYGYDSNASRSPFPKELEGILDGLGVSVSDDTIRDKLKEAAELLPQNVESCDD